MTEVWVRNPGWCIREAIEANVLDIVFDIGYLVRREIDLDRWLPLFMPGCNYRVLLVGRANQGAKEIVPGTSVDYPSKTHPVWEYGQPLKLLISYMKDPAIERVVVTQLPDLGRQPGARTVFQVLSELQEEYPQTKLHIHALYSFRTMFAPEFGAVDIDPRTKAAYEEVFLPNGKIVAYKAAATTYAKWIAMLGMNPKTLDIPRNRCIVNIKSALWAAKHWNDLDRFVTEFEVGQDVREDEPEFERPQSQRIMISNKKSKEGDKFLCNLCSLQVSCRYFREGAVCAVPESEPTELARFFKSRDSNTIIEGLGTLLAANTRRLKRGVEKEEMTGDLDPEVSKIMSQVFDGGVKLAKLVDPKLAAAGAAKIQVNNQQINSSGATPQALMASIVSELEGRGVPRDQITPEMVTGLLNMQKEERQSAIEAHGIAKDA